MLPSTLPLPDSYLVLCGVRNICAYVMCSVRVMKSSCIGLPISTK